MCNIYTKWSIIWLFWQLFIKKLHIFIKKHTNIVILPQNWCTDDVHCTSKITIISHFSAKNREKESILPKNEQFILKMDNYLLIQHHEKHHLLMLIRQEYHEKHTFRAKKEPRKCLLSNYLQFLDGFTEKTQIMGCAHHLWAVKVNIIIKN